MKSVLGVFLGLLLLVNANPFLQIREKRQIPGLGGLGSFGAIPGLGSIGGGGLPGLSKPTIVQPQAGQPCPVALVPQQFGGGLKFGNPFNFGLNLKGQDGKNGPWGTGFDTSFGNELGGSIFGDAGHKAVPIECQESAGAPPTSASSGPQPRPASGSGSGSAVTTDSDNPVARVLAQNPDLLRRAIEQNPDLIKGVANRRQVESALTDNPEMIRQALLENPELIKAALAAQGAQGVQGQGSQPEVPQPATFAKPSPALRDAVFRKLTTDPATLRRFVRDHGRIARVVLKRAGFQQTLSDTELVDFILKNPQFLARMLDANPGLVDQVATAYRISQNWDQPIVPEKWGPAQASVYNAFQEDPFFMKQVFDENPLYFKASLKKGKFELGELSMDQVKQTFYENPKFIRTLLARDGVFSKHIQKKYAVIPGKKYERKVKSDAEKAFDILDGDEARLRTTFSVHPQEVEQALRRQGVDPAKASTEDVITSYRKHNNLLKLMLLQSPGMVQAVLSEQELSQPGEPSFNLGPSLPGQLPIPTGEEVPYPNAQPIIRTGNVDTQIPAEQG